MSPQVSLRRLNFYPDRLGNDEEKTFQWRNHPEVYNWCRQTDVLHPELHKQWFEWQATDKTVSMYGITNDDYALVGVCGLTSIDLVNSRAEFSLYIGPENQGMGYGEMALRLLLKKGFNSYGLNSIWGESFEGNPAMKMFKRVGFREEGRRRQFYFRDGKFIDAILFSILRSEYA